MHEIGVFLGGSNLIGDIGSRKVINTKSPAFGVVYKYNITTRYSFRGSFSYSKVENKNFFTSDLNRFLTFLSTSNQITEFSTGVEFNFFDFNLHDHDFDFSPYLYLGINYFQYDLYYTNKNQPLIPVKYGSDLELSIPLTLGAKVKLSKQFVLSFEMGARYTFTDNLDGSNPVGEFEKNPNLKHGSLYNNDWYVFTGITLSFTFGRLPCYCK
mgnify:CR=1 FL=1|tara:strand:- start:6018 stop:6653 length:636 start_codon:yes stop_codon:yes gene_type:complete